MKLWGGRYEGGTDPAMHTLNRSILFDQRLWRVDLEGSIAWARALRQAGLLSGEEVGSIVEGLRTVIAEWESGELSRGGK